MESDVYTPTTEQVRQWYATWPTTSAETRVRERTNV